MNNMPAKTKIIDADNGMKEFMQKNCQEDLAKIPSIGRRFTPREIKDACNTAVSDLKMVMKGRGGQSSRSVEEIEDIAKAELGKLPRKRK